MSDERVFRIGDSNDPHPLTETSLANQGLWERRNLQEWVIARPEILGEGIMIIAFEFDRWQAASGERQLDRLDVLGLDRDGFPVIAELKRDRAPDTVQLQAIKYAAMISRFTVDDLARLHARYLQDRGHEITDDSAMELLTDHAPDIDTESIRRPRIVIVASGFRPTTTASVVWLTEMGLDITLQQVQLYHTGAPRSADNSGLLMTVSQLYPLQDVEEFTVAPIKNDSKRAARSRREKSVVVRLAESGAIADGTALTLRPTTEVTADIRDRVLAWIAADPRRGRAYWHNNRSKPIEWEYTGERSRPTPIIQQVLAEAAEVERSVRGPDWWTDDEGRSLTQLAGPSSRGFDWTGLHEALAVLPAGAWTAYQDLAELIGTAPQPLGGHISSCRDCTSAHRVLTSSGVPADGFRWSDPTRTDTPRDVLESEGVRFVDGKADQSQRLTADQIRALLD